MENSYFSPFEWYDTPVYYDMIFSADNELECDFLEGVLEKHATARGRRVLEPACGSGRLVEAMARRGYHVSGFDINDNMLQFAAERLRSAGLRAHLSNARLEEFSFPEPFDLAHCLVSTFKYLLDEASAESHLRSVARALRVGGVYVLGFHLSDYETQSRSRERWFAKRADLTVTCNIQTWPPDRRRRLERVRSRLLVRQRGKHERLETHWTFRTYNAAQTRRLLSRVPELEHVATYDFNYDLTAGRLLDDTQLDTILILRRRAPI